MTNQLNTSKPPSEDQETQRTNLVHNSPLAVVVIARNEERRIEACLTALMAALTEFPTTRIILVDSCSTDETLAIARQFPVEIYRYHGPPFSAAAGRRVGFAQCRSQHVLFVDGDCCVEPDWIRRGLDALQSDAKAGVAYGLRREVFERADAAAVRAAPAAGLSGLGGNGLYKHEAIDLAGGFNPYLPGGEEAELLARIRLAGFHEISTPYLMFTHYTRPKTSIDGYFDRVSRGLVRGLGQTLRVSLGHGLFGHHVRRLNRYLLAMGYIIMGAIAALISFLLNRPAILLTWLGIGLAAFGLLCVRRRSLRSAVFIFADWVIVALHIPGDFLRKPRDPKEFRPNVERLQ